MTTHAQITAQPALLQNILAELIGLARPVTRVAAVGGGSISCTLRVEADDARWFVKLGRADRADMFAAEHDGLVALRQCTAIRVPEVLACATIEHHACIVMEYLVLRPIGSHADALKAGRSLAELHRLAGPSHGWQRDNFIGSSPQRNTTHADWTDFFSHQRLLPQLETAARHGFPKGLVSDAMRVLDQLPQLLNDHTPTVSLVHGDLWHGNAAIDESGLLALFDPATYYGDRETDIAMSCLFGGFPDAFYRAYHDAWPLPDGAQRRRTVYNLYHVLNHFNLFGAAYLGQAEQMIGRLVGELR